MTRRLEVKRWPGRHASIGFFAAWSWVDGTGNGFTVRIGRVLWIVQTKRAAP